MKKLFLISENENRKNFLKNHWFGNVKLRLDLLPCLLRTLRHYVYPERAIHYGLILVKRCKMNYLPM